MYNPTFFLQTEGGASRFGFAFDTKALVPGWYTLPSSAPVHEYLSVCVCVCVHNIDIWNELLFYQTNDH